MEVRTSRADVVWSYLGVIISLFVSVFNLPIIIYFLDGDMLGLWYVFSSISAITILFDFGFTPTFARNITYCWSGAVSIEKSGGPREMTGQTDFALMRDILVTCRKVYLYISVIALILLLSLGTSYIIYISSSVSGNGHIIGWIIYVIATFLNLYYNYYDSFLRGVGNVKRANQNRIYARIIQFLSMLIFLNLGYGIIGLSVSYLLFGIVFRFLGKHYFYKFNNIGAQLNSVEGAIVKERIKELFKTIWYNAWRDGIVSLSAYLSGQASVIICSLYLSLTETGIYSIGVQIVSVVISISSTLFFTYQPTIQSNWVNNNKNEVKRILLKELRTFILLFILGILGVVFIGLPILKYVKHDVIISVPVLLGIFASQFVLRFRDCFTTYLSCTNRLYYMKSFIISSFLCLLLSLVFLEYFNLQIWGLIYAQIISQVLFNAWYWPLFVYKELK